MNTHTYNYFHTHSCIYVYKPWVHLETSNFNPTPSGIFPAFSFYVCNFLFKQLRHLAPISFQYILIYLLTQFTYFAHLFSKTDLPSSAALILLLTSTPQPESQDTLSADCRYVNQTEGGSRHLVGSNSYLAFTELDELATENFQTVL